MPLEFDDVDDEEPGRGRPRFSRFDEPKGPWWKPTSKTGRVVLAGGALLALGTMTAAGLALRTYLERDARFRITGSEDIQATGLTEVSRAQMLPVFGEDVGRNIFFVPLQQRRKELEQIPWIQRATVMRLLPDQIRVAVVERQPVAFTRHGSEIGLVDAQGVLLSMPAAAMARHHYSFPVLTGIDPGDPAAARRTRMEVYLRLMSELDAGGHRYSDQISEIDLTDPEDARVTIPEQGTDILAHFGEDRFLERYQRYQAHIAEWRQQYPHLSAVDLRYDQQVVLEMASGAQTAQASAADAAQPGNAKAATAKPAPGEPAAAKTSAAVGKAKAPSHAKAAVKSVQARKKAALDQKKRVQQRRLDAKRAAMRASQHRTAGKVPQTAHTAAKAAGMAQGG